MKILIVDDEMLARETIHSMVMEFAGNSSIDVEILQAKDGEEALPIIRAYHPLIVIADIMMPRLSGIELLSQVNQWQLSIVFIFVSGYDSFEYAQSAVSLGAFSYLLKPVQQNELEETLMRAHFKLEHEHVLLKDNLNRELMFQKNLKMLQKSWMTKLVMNEATSSVTPESAIKNHLREINIRFQYDHFAVMLIHLNFLAEDSYGTNNRFTSIPSEASQAVTEIFPKWGLDCYEFDVEHKLGYILNCVTSGDPKAMISAAIQKVAHDLHRSYGCIVSIGIGLFTVSLNKLNISYRDAASALFQTWFHDQDAAPTPSHLVFYESDASSETILDKEIKTYEEKLGQQLALSAASGNTLFALEIIQKYYRIFFNHHLGFSADIISKLNFQTIMILIRFLEQAGLDAGDILGNELSLYNKLNSCRTEEAVSLWCKDKISIVVEAVKAACKNNHVKMVNQVKDFVKHNIDKNISLTVAASHIFLTPQYLSKIFHQIEGDNFANYVKKTKLEKAKQMLRQGYKPNEVSETLGFNDAKYFFKVFKQATGLSPSSYKKMGIGRVVEE